MSSRQNAHRAAKTNADPAAVWIGKFNAVHRATCATGQQYVSETFKMGDTLIAAKADLKEKRQHGRFEKMMRELPIKERSAQYLMTISKDERLRKAHHGALLLPTSWRTLAEITRLTDKEFEEAVANGTIDEETRRRDIEEIINARSLQQVVAASSRARAKVTMSEADFEARARPQAAVETLDAGFEASPRARATGEMSLAQRNRMNQERESNTPEINLYEAGRKGTACSFVRDVGDLWRRYADRCDLEAAREIALADPAELATVRSAIDLAIKFKGVLDQAGTRGNPHLRLIEEGPPDKPGGLWRPPCR